MSIILQTYYLKKKKLCDYAETNSYLKTMLHHHDPQYIYLSINA